MVPGTSRLKNQGPGFEPGPRSYFSWIAEISESHASHIMRRALLRTKTSAPPPFSRLSAGATIHALYAVSLGTTGRGDRTWYPFHGKRGSYLVPFSAHPGQAQLTRVGHIRRCQSPTVSTKRGARRVRIRAPIREL